MYIYIYIYGYMDTEPSSVDRVSALPAPKNTPRVPAQNQGARRS